MAYLSTINSKGSRGINFALAAGSAAIFAVAVTNCAVYSSSASCSGSQSPGSGTTSSGSGTVTTQGLDSTCSTIMLVVNIILAIFSFIFMVIFLWWAIAAPTITAAVARWIPGYNPVPPPHQQVFPPQYPQQQYPQQLQYAQPQYAQQQYPQQLQYPQPALVPQQQIVTQSPGQGQTTTLMVRNLNT